MKIICFTALLIGFCTWGFAQTPNQNPNIDELRQRLYGIWQDTNNSNNELIINPDNIQEVDSGIVRMTYTYSFSKEACNTNIKLPAATGIYLLESYNDRTVCCALGEVGYFYLKITYPGNRQVSYRIRSEIPPTPKKQ